MAFLLPIAMVIVHSTYCVTVYFGHPHALFLLGIFFCVRAGLEKIAEELQWKRWTTIILILNSEEYLFEVFLIYFTLSSTLVSK